MPNAQRSAVGRTTMRSTSSKAAIISKILEILDLVKTH
jgi:hypothetical protein